MKWVLMLLGCLGAASAAELAGAHTVYVMPMGHSLDQFIANRLTRMHVLRVVTDPAKADSIITDQLGMPFEDRLKDFYPPPAQPAPPPKEPAKETEPPSPYAQSPASMLANTANQAGSAGSMGFGGRGRGTIFLVDVKSRQVLWSTFQKPKSSSPRELDHTAVRVVKQLKLDLTPKKQ